MSEAEDTIFSTGSLDGTVLLKLLERLCDEAHVFRIWWATVSLTYRECEQCGSLGEVISVARGQIDADMPGFYIRCARPTTVAPEPGSLPFKCKCSGG